jgi:hypothetical protein
MMRNSEEERILFGSGRAINWSDGSISHTSTRRKMLRNQH